MTAPDVSTIRLRPRAVAASTSLASSRGSWRVSRYLMERGWAHLLLLAGIGLFLFPFAYMLGTSLKTDEELTAAAWFPAIPTFRAASPYVREADSVQRPVEAPLEKWQRLLPKFRSLTRAAVDAAPITPAA